MDWLDIADDKARRHEEGRSRADDERAIVRQGNVAYAAALGYLMAGDPRAGAWFRRAATDWRESWDAGEATAAWGRPIGAVKAALLAGDEGAVEELARWALDLGTATAPSPIGRYAACLALLALRRWGEARDVASSLRGRDDFPQDVADALATISAHDVLGAIAAVESVADSFVDREGYLEDMAVADTALVLQLLAERRGIEVELPASTVLP